MDDYLTCGVKDGRRTWRPLARPIPPKALSSHRTIIVCSCCWHTWDLNPPTSPSSRNTMPRLPASQLPKVKVWEALGSCRPTVFLFLKRLLWKETLYVKDSRSPSPISSLSLSQRHTNTQTFTHTSTKSSYWTSLQCVRAFWHSHVTIVCGLLPGCKYPDLWGLLSQLVSTVSNK